MMCKADGSMIRYVSVPVPVDAERLAVSLARMYGGDPAEWAEEIEAVQESLAAGAGGRLEMALAADDEGGAGIDLSYGLSEGGRQGARAEQVLLALCLSALAQEFVSPVPQRAEAAGEG